MPPRALRVLIVEDEAILRSLVADILYELGHESIAFEDGDSALAHVRAGGPGVDLAIIDLVLPGKSGLATLLALRELRPGLPAIVSSGFDAIPGGPAEGLLAAARKEGAEVLPKPYRIEQLEAALARLAP